MKATLLLIVTKPVPPEISVIGGSYMIRRIGSRLDNTTEPYIIHSKQFTNTIYGWVQGYSNVSLGSLDSSPDVRKGVIGWSGNSSDVTGMKPPGPIGGNIQQGYWKSSFDIFNQGSMLDSMSGISDFSNRRSPWHDEILSENSGCEIFFQNAGRKTF